jgi:hypothetical protein
LGEPIEQYRPRDQIKIAVIIAHHHVHVTVPIGVQERRRSPSTNIDVCKRVGGVIPLDLLIDGRCGAAGVLQVDEVAVLIAHHHVHVTVPIGVQERWSSNLTNINVCKRVC